MGESAQERLDQRYLTDFSSVWKGVQPAEGGVTTDVIDENYEDRWRKAFEKASNTTSISVAGIGIMIDTAGNMVIQGGGRQTIHIAAANRQEFIQALNTLKPPAATLAIPPVNIPATGEMSDNRPEMVARKRTNEDSYLNAVNRARHR